MRYTKYIILIIALISIPAFGYQHASNIYSNSKIVVSYDNFFYKVKHGDSLNSIAKRFKLTVGNLKSINRIKENYIRAGDTLIIAKPGRKNLYILRKSINSSILAYTKSYIVKKGDTLYFISRRFSTNVAFLKKFNHIGREPLKIGRKLLVPGKSFVSYRFVPVEKLMRKMRIRLVRHDKLHLFLSSRYKVVRIAERYLGSPYKFGGESFKTGIDCSAFVMKVFRKINIRLPRTTWGQHKYGIKIPLSSIRVGDLVFFNTRRGPHSHVGIYIGHNKFIHASSGRVHDVTISRLAGFYKRHFNHAVRVIKH